MPHRPKPVENYTNPFLVMAGVVLFTALFMLWAFFGYVASLATSVLVHLAIDRLPRRD